MKFDCDENGGKITARDVWNFSNHMPKKLVVAMKRDEDGEIFDARYVVRAKPGAKYRCEESDIPGAWFVEFGEHPCKFCMIDGKEKCKAESIVLLELDALILDVDAGEVEENEDDDDELDS